MDFRLVNLDCPACGSSLSASPHDTLFLCAHCGIGAVLEDEGLSIVESSALLPVPGRRAETWRPGWTIETGVEINQRRLFGGREMQGWSGRRVFVIPAFPLSLVDLTTLARALSDAAHTTGEVPREPCNGGTLDLEDARALIRHIVIGDEARKPDKLSSVNVVLTPISHRITALPFRRDGDFLQCSITDVRVRGL